MKTWILQGKIPSRRDFKWIFPRNCEGTEQLRVATRCGLEMRTIYKKPRDEGIL